MRIAYISSSVVPSRSANSVHVMKMCQALTSIGHEVALLTLDQGGAEPGVDDVFEFYGVARGFDISVVPWPRLRGGAFLAGYAAAITAKRSEPDLVHGRFLHGCAFAAMLGLPVVFEAHATIPQGTTAELFRLLIRLEGFRGVVVISRALRDLFLRDFPELAGRIFVAHDGADPVSSGESPPRRTSREIHVGYVGSFYRGRGIELIVELATRCPWARFHLVGGTLSDLDGTSLAAPPNLTAHGFLPPPAAEAVRVQCDVLLAPYQRSVAVYGGGRVDTAAWMSPLKVFEYMAAGKAIIASRMPALQEVLVDGENALLCAPDDVVEWQSALERLANDVGLREALGRSAQRHFLDRYTWRARAEAILERGPCSRHLRSSVSDEARPLR